MRLIFVAVMLFFFSGNLVFLGWQAQKEEQSSVPIVFNAVMATFALLAIIFG